MFRGIPVLFGILLAAQSGLQNGIHLSELPNDGTSFEVIAGYRAGLRNESGGTSGLAAAISAFLSSSVTGRQLALAAYGAGGEFEFFSELDRSGIRLRVPAWARPTVEPLLAAFLAESPSKDSAGLASALIRVRERARNLDIDFRARAEDEIRIALLGSRPYHHPPGGWARDVEQLSTKDIEQFFSENYGTDQAFVLLTGPASQVFAEVAPRSSREVKGWQALPLKAERLLRFPEQESGGVVIFASPVTTVFYRGWYSVLMLDRLLQRVVSGKPSSSLIPALDPYYYRLETPVPAGQFDNQVQESLLQELERLQYVLPTEQQLALARSSAIEYLQSPAINYWFLSLGIPDRREEGMEWIRAFSADDMRIAARELLLSNRVIASWSPKPKLLKVQTESLGGSSAVQSGDPALPQAPELIPIRPLAFPLHPPHDGQEPGLARGIASPAIPVLKALLDRKLIEAGLWTEVRLEIGGPESSRLLVAGSGSGRQRVESWIKEFGATPPSEDELVWAREAAIHRRDLPSVTMADLGMVTSEQVQDAARIHLVN